MGASCEGDICLVGGSSALEGNVYVRDKPVCDDSWGIRDARVVCKSLKFANAIAATSNSK